MSHSVSYRNHGFYLTMSGVISQQELEAANALIVGSLNFDDHTHQVINLLEADLSDLDYTTAKKTGAMNYSASRTRTDVKVALITNASSHAFCEQYIVTAKHLGSSWEFELFDNLTAAIEWTRAN